MICTLKNQKLKLRLSVIFTGPILRKPENKRMKEKIENDRKRLK